MSILGSVMGHWLLGSVPGKVILNFFFLPVKLILDIIHTCVMS